MPWTRTIDEEARFREVGVSGGTIQRCHRPPRHVELILDQGRAQRACLPRVGHRMAFRVVAELARVVPCSCSDGVGRAVLARDEIESHRHTQGLKLAVVRDLRRVSSNGCLEAGRSGALDCLEFRTDAELRCSLRDGQTRSD